PWPSIVHPSVNALGNHHSTTHRPLRSESDTGSPSWSGSVNSGASVPSASMAPRRTAVLGPQPGDAVAAVLRHAAFIPPHAVQPLGAGGLLQALGHHALGLDHPRNDQDVPRRIPWHLPPELVQAPQLD